MFQENPKCTKNNNRDKLLLTSLADQLDLGRGRDRLARDRLGRARGEGGNNIKKAESERK